MAGAVGCINDLISQIIIDLLWIILLKFAIAFFVLSQIIS